MKIPSKNESQIYTFQTCEGWKNSLPEDSCTIRNVKEISPSDRKEIIPYGNVDLHKGMKSTVIGENVSKYKSFLFQCL